MKWDEVIDELDKKHIGDREAKTVVLLCGFGRLVKNKKAYSFNVIALSGSSAGKDHLMLSVLKMFPRDDYEVYARTSKTSLNYLHTLDQEPNWTYDGKMILLKEITPEALNNEVMKEFTSGEDEVSKIAITKQKGAGVDVKEVRGHPCVFVTTATTRPSEEIINRFSIVKLDESEEQTRATRKVYNQQEYDEAIKGEIADLKAYEVEIPEEILNFVDKHFPVNKLRYRRDYPKFIDWIKAVAIFNQKDRLGNSNVIIVHWEDYNIARDVFMNSYSGLADIPLKETDKRIIGVLDKSDNPLSAREITDALAGRISLQGLYKHLDNLKNNGILDGFELKDPFGHVVTKYAVSEEYKDKSPIKLPVYTYD